jgi:hypothetical protein
MAEAGAKAAAGDVVAAIVANTDGDETRIRRRASSAVLRLGVLVAELEAAPDLIEAKYAKIEKLLDGKTAELRDAKRDLAQAKRDLKAAQAFLAGLED